MKWIAYNKGFLNDALFIPFLGVLFEDDSEDRFFWSPLGLGYNINAFDRP